MKKVIFISLLSIAACLSVVGAAATPTQPPKDAPQPHETKPAVPPAAPVPTNATTAAPASTPHADAAPAPAPAPADKKTNADDNKTTPDGKKTEPTKDDQDKEKPTAKPSPPTSPPVTPPAAHDQTTSTAKPTEPPKPTASTKTTEVPPPHKEGDKIVQARGFDGASFVGGIILTLGMLAIGFMGFKYYKSQTERNYHTL